MHLHLQLFTLIQINETHLVIDAIAVADIKADAQCEWTLILQGSNLILNNVSREMFSAFTDMCVSVCGMCVCMHACLHYWTLDFVQNLQQALTIS